MVPVSKILLTLSIFLFISCASCKKSPISVETQPKPGYEQPEDVKQQVKDSIPADAKLINIGVGYGNLMIDGNTLNITGNAKILIMEGAYQTVTLKNLIAQDGYRIYVKGSGVVSVTESMYTDNLKNVTISGEINDDIKHGFKFQDIKYRAILMNGSLTGVTLKNLQFKNVSNYVIAGERSNGQDFRYLGTPETRTQKFKILNCIFENAGTISFGGSFDKNKGEDTGFFQDVEIAYNTFQNTDAGSVCSFTNVQNYNIHHNVVNNVNFTNNNHNGIFFMEGSGSFHDNKLTNYQGNAIRMWLYSRGNVPETNMIYNNICYNTRKYGAFELQAFERQIAPGKTTFVNAKVFNNTVGRMNTSKDWDGQILDLYNTGGSLEFYNNLGFELVSNTAQPSNMIHNISGVKPLVDKNNLYYKTLNDAVYDNVNFKSKVPGIGAL
ncbi:hypothetical protein ACTHQF_16840 [Pedobacter sp. SAFR-022]|uniref:hypothetical protein n=1 Tax=Pedobacter sp. SAFR-022 TaxID=3436861 RepID=UPI003F815141